MMRGTLVKLRRRNWADWLLWGQAFIWLGLMRLATRLVPLRHLARFLGRAGAETPSAISDSHLAIARRIRWAVVSASRYTPWESDCFPQACVAQYLLRRRGVSSTLYLGAMFGTTQQFADIQEGKRELRAHAWLRCGSYIITGWEGHQSFGKLATFASLM